MLSSCPATWVERESVFSVAICPALCGLSPLVSLSVVILQARILERVAMPSSRRSSRPRIKPTFPACIPCISRQILYYLSHPGSSGNSRARIKPRQLQLLNTQLVHCTILLPREERLREGCRCLWYGSHGKLLGGGGIWHLNGIQKEMCD